MLVWGSIMLLINVVLVSAIVIILVRSRRAFKAVISTARISLAESGVVADALKAEMATLRCAQGASDQRTESLSDLNVKIVERHREIEQALSRAQDVARHIDAIYSRHPDGVDYSGAQRLLRSGVPSKEVMARLGLNKGEFDLISNISNYRS